MSNMYAILPLALAAACLNAQTTQTVTAPVTGTVSFQVILPTSTAGDGSGMTQAQVYAMLNQSLPAGRNLFDPSRRTVSAAWSNVTNGIRLSNSMDISDYIPVVAGTTYAYGGVQAEACPISSCSEYGAMYFDSNQQPLASGFVLAQNFAQGVTFTAPAGSYWIRVPCRTSLQGNCAVTIGTSAPASPSSFATNPDTTATKSPWKGKRVAFLGDSYTQVFGYAWQTALEQFHNMTPVFQDARSNRSIAEALECYPNGSNAGSQLSPDGGGWGSCAQANNGTQGNSLAQDLAAASPDLLIIELGMNSYNAMTVGTTADALDAATIHGAIKAAIAAYQQAAPNLRIVWITPPTPMDTNNGRNIEVPLASRAIVQECALAGIPVIDLNAVSGINKYNGSGFFLQDNVHLTYAGFTGGPWLLPIQDALYHVFPIK